MNGQQRVGMFSALAGAAMIFGAVVSPMRVQATIGGEDGVRNYIETSHTLACGTTTITLHNVSPWIYPVSVYIDGATAPSYGPTLDNRTNGQLDGPQKDATKSRTITFPEDTGVHTVSFVVNAGSESDLYRNLPVGTMTTYTVQSDCLPPAPVYSYNLTSMCRPSETEASLRIRNGSPTNQAYTLELVGGSALNGTAVPGDSLRTVAWLSGNDTWILRIDGQNFTKAIGNNPLCEVPTTTVPPTTVPVTTVPVTMVPVTTVPVTATTAAATTTSLASEAPIPTETSVASEAPVATTAVAGASGSLPSTGSPSSVLMLGGLAMMSFGSVLTALARRSTPTS
jgi:LPXTG-motif cell wall-anchored protein